MCHSRVAEVSLKGNIDTSLHITARRIARLPIRLAENVRRVQLHYEQTDAPKTIEGGLADHEVNDDDLGCSNQKVCDFSILFRELGVDYTCNIS